jgi:ankyrin repeat protein
MDNLSRKLTRREVRAALGRLPKELDETYDQAMQRIQDQDEDEAALAHKVLCWISYALRPLTVTELQHALAVQLGDDDLDEDGIHEPELIVSVCAGLVTLDEESDHIRLVHYTTQSYFERIRTSRFPGAYSSMAQTCLTYLAFGPFSQRYCMSEDELHTRYEWYPFLKYAARNWGYHVRQGIDRQLHELTLEFLSSSISVLSTAQVLSNLLRDDAYEDSLLDSAVTWDFSFLGPPNPTPNLTPLYNASLYGLADIARDLISQGASLNDKQYGTDEDLTLLHIAAQQGHAEMVGLLLHAGAEASPIFRDPSCPEMTALSMAVKEGHLPTVQAFVDGGVDCNRLNVNRMSPLAIAVTQNHIDIVRYLIDKGANIDGKPTAQKPVSTHQKLSFHGPADGDTEGDTEDDTEDDIEGMNDDSSSRSKLNPPLHSAAEYGSEFMARLLLDHGADMSLTDTWGETALHAR